MWSVDHFNHLASFVLLISIDTHRETYWQGFLVDLVGLVGYTHKCNGTTLGNLLDIGVVQPERERNLSNCISWS